MDMRTGEIRNLSEIPREQLKHFVPLPDHDENGRPVRRPNHIDLLPALNPASGLKWDAKPEAHRRAIDANRAGREILKQSAPAPEGIVAAEDLSIDERAQLLGIASV